MGVKLIVLYPPAKDQAAFDARYAKEHLPLGARNLTGATRLTTTKIVGSPSGSPAFARLTEVHFPSKEVLRSAAMSAGGRETIAHAAEISSGGAPIFLVAEDGA